eukprot:jgi/Chrzof1/4131/Cz14g00090.t1
MPQINGRTRRVLVIEDNGVEMPDTVLRERFFNLGHTNKGTRSLYSKYGHGVLQSLGYLSEVAFAFSSYIQPAADDGQSSAQLEWTAAVCGPAICSPAGHEATAFLPMAPGVDDFMTLMDGFESLEASTAALKARALMLAKYRAPLSPYHDFPDLAAEFDCFNGDKKRSGVKLVLVLHDDVPFETVPLGIVDSKLHQDLLTNISQWFMPYKEHKLWRFLPDARLRPPEPVIRVEGTPVDWRCHPWRREVSSPGAQKSKVYHVK